MTSMKATGSSTFVEISLSPFEGVSLVKGQLLWANTQLDERKLHVKRLYRGSLVTAGSEEGKLAVSATDGRRTALIDVAGGEVFVPLDRLVFFNGHLSIAKAFLKLRGRTPRTRKWKAVSFKGNGLVGIAYTGEFTKKDLELGERLELNADHLMACQSAEPLKGKLVNDSLYKVLFVDEVDRRIIIRGPGFAYVENGESPETED